MSRSAMVCLFTVAFALLITAAPASAEMNSFRYTDAFAQAFVETDDGCLYTQAFLSAGADFNKEEQERPEKTSGASLSIFQFNRCNFTFLSGWGFVENVDYQSNASARQASLKATIPVSFYDWWTGTEITINATVDLVFTGTNEVDREIRNTHYFYPGMKIHSSWSGTQREATLSGTFLMGDTPLSLADARARIAFDRSNSVRISKE